MDFIDIFSISDVFKVALGLMLASIIRLYYASYLEKKKISNFSNSLTIYNTLMEDTQSGLIIITNNDKILFSNTIASDMLNTKGKDIDSTYLENIYISDVYSNKKEKFIQGIHAQHHMTNVCLETDDYKLPISIEINKTNMNSDSYNHEFLYIIIMHDMTKMNALKEDVTHLLD